jgi:hypothetical protein
MYNYKDAKSKKGEKVGVALCLFVLVLDMIETFCLLWVIDI